MRKSLVEWYKVSTFALAFENEPQRRWQGKETG